MADRYWVGGTGTWDTSTTTHWSATSGGAAGASAPTAADNVFINGSSGTGTITSSTGAVCANLDCTGYTGTLTATTFSINVQGSLTLSTGMTLTATSAFVLTAPTGGSYTINTNGKSPGNVFIGSTSTGFQGTYTLLGALTSTNVITFYSGTLDTNGFALTCAGFTSLSSPSTNARTLTLGASTVTLSGANPLQFGVTNTYLTLNAGTSSIVCSGSGTGTFSGAGKTFYNVSFTGTSVSARTISGANTYNNWTLSNRAAGGWNYYVLTENQTVNGTLTLSSSGASYFRSQLRAAAVNTPVTSPVTITAASFGAGSTAWDFVGITIAGAAAPISGTRFGDAGDNSGITFDTPKTVYKNATGTTAITSLAWSNTSGGAGNNIYFPLPQDTAIFDNNSNATFAASTNQLSGTLDFSARTTSLTFSVGASVEIYGNLIFGSGVTVSTTTTRLFFYGTANQTFTPNGIAITTGVTVGKTAGTLTLGGAVTQGATATLPFTVQNGAVSFGSYSHTFVQLTATDNTFTQTLTFGGGSITIGTTNVAPVQISSGTTTASGSNTFYITNTGTITRTISSNATGLRYSDYYVTGGTAGSVSFSGTVGKIDFSNGGAGTFTGSFANTIVSVYGDFKLKSGMSWTTQANTVTFQGGAGTNNIDFAGITGGCPIAFNNTEGGGWVLQSAYATSNSTTYSSGSINLAGYSFTTSSLSFPSTGSFEFNGATVTLTASGTVWSFAGTATLTNSSGTATVAMTSASTKTFAGNSNTYPVTLSQGGTGALIVSGSNTFNNITNTVVGTVQFTAGTTTTFATGFNLNGTSTAARLTLGSTSTSQATLKKATTWYMGAGSLDSGNNTNLTFTAGGGIDFLNVSYINGTVGGTTYASTITETATGTDSVSTATTFASDISETATGTDSIAAAPAVTAGWGRGAWSSGAWGSDATTYASSISETATGTDATSASAVFAGAVTETGTGTDVVSALRTLFGTVTDTATGTDATSASAAFAGSVTEIGTGTDSTSVSVAFVGTVTDTATGSDTISAGPAYSNAVSETATGTDTTAATATFSGAVADSATGSDTTSATSTYPRQVSETATGTDSYAALAAFSGVVSESAAASDLVAAISTFLATVAELSTASDTISAVVPIRVSVNESSTASDAVSPTYTARPTISETATITDFIQAQASFAVRVQELATGSDLVSTLQVALAYLQETGTASDLIAAAISFNRAIEEGATITEAVAAAQQAAATIVESASGTDASTAANTVQPSVTETATVTDTDFGTVSVSGSVLETATVTGVVPTTATLSPTLQETASGTDTTSSKGRFNIFVTATASAADTLFTSAVLRSTITETASALDAYIAAYLWNLIDDAQTPNWASVADTQNPNWGGIDDSQDPNWHNIDTL